MTTDVRTNLDDVFEDTLPRQIEGDLIALLDDWASLPEKWDNELDKQIATWYSNPPDIRPKYPYFSPSSLGDCPRELYIKARYGNKAKDVTRDKPWRGRWRGLGTLGGDYIQRELLAIKRNYENLTGNVPRFEFESNEDGTPRFEDFAKTNKLVEHNGEEFYLFGSPDGIMTYTTDSGEKVRVGLEIKSKQGTPARTSMYSMKGPDEAHAQQVIAYSEMYDCDYYVILYINYAKQGWNMTDEQYAKTPDIRAFCMKVTDSDKSELFSKAASIVKAVRDKTPPKLNIDKWNFNNFKMSTAMSLTEEEVEELRKQAEQIKNSSMPRWLIASWNQTVVEIETIRKEGGL